MSSDKLKKGHSLSKAQAQLDRFKQTARELGCDETGEAFERAFAKAVPAKRPTQAQDEPSVLSKSAPDASARSHKS